MRSTRLVAITSCLVSPLLFAAPAPEREFRAVWVTRFEWPDPDPLLCRANIDEIIKTLAARGFNAVMFQVRGQCDTLYPSPEEPWSPHISPTGSDPGWDPLAYAIQAAHAHHLEFHAYVNTHVAWQSHEHALPAAASHPLFKHFNAADPKACDWLAHAADGKPVQWGEDDYAWIAPGVPEAQAYTRRQILYLVSNYDIDGVHLDRIRTGGAEFSHDPISMARFAGEQANPMHLPLDAWTTDQITRFVGDLYAQINEIKPQIKVSSAPVGLTRQDRYPEYPPKFQFAVAKCHQDAQAWLAAGAMDFLVPQIYWSDHDNRPPDFSRVLPDWLDHAAGRHVYPGLNSTVGAVELVHEIQVTRKWGALGNVIFSYRGLKQRDKFAVLAGGRGVYAAPVATPDLPWKESPVEGIILGRVTDERTAQPLVDAQVRRTGSDEVALTSADGVYSFLKVVPGRYDLRIRKPGWADRQMAAMVVSAGQVARVNVVLAASPTALAVAHVQATTRPTPTATVQAVHAAAATSRPAGTALSWASRLFLGILAVIILAGGAIGVWMLIGRLRGRT